MDVRRSGWVVGGASVLWGGAVGLGLGALVGSIIVPVVGTMYGAAVGVAVGLALGLVEGVVLVLVAARTRDHRVLAVAATATALVGAGAVLALLAPDGGGGDLVTGAVLVGLLLAPGLAWHVGPWAVLGTRPVDRERIAAAAGLAVAATIGSALVAGVWSAVAPDADVLGAGWAGVVGAVAAAAVTLLLVRRARRRAAAPRTAAGSRRPPGPRASSAVPDDACGVPPS